MGLKHYLPSSKHQSKKVNFLLILTGYSQWCLLESLWLVSCNIHLPNVYIYTVCIADLKDHQWSSFYPTMSYFLLCQTLTHLTLLHVLFATFPPQMRGKRHFPCVCSRLHLGGVGGPLWIFPLQLTASHSMCRKKHWVAQLPESLIINEWALWLFVPPQESENPLSNWLLQSLLQSWSWSGFGVPKQLLTGYLER